MPRDKRSVKPSKTTPFSPEEKHDLLSSFSREHAELRRRGAVHPASRGDGKITGKKG